MIAAHADESIPVILDTDIGTDIDDAYALAQVISSPELKLLGVTTVSGDAVARARLAAKLLAVAGRADVPVYAGTSGPAQPRHQTQWADGFASPALHNQGGVEFLRAQINSSPGRITLIAIGEMTNIAALLESEPGISAKIRCIAIMGGSVHHGYSPESGPKPEWNIRSNVAAARKVFASNVPLLVAPLDSTIALRLGAAERVRIFSRGTPVNDALASLDFIWRHTNDWKGNDPILYDSLAVALVAAPGLAKLTPLHLEIDDDGLTRPVSNHAPNARVALAADPEAFLKYFTARLTQ